jgi:hypothetical protein
MASLPSDPTAEGPAFFLLEPAVVHEDGERRGREGERERESKKARERHESNRKLMHLLITCTM